MLKCIAGAALFFVLSIGAASADTFTDAGGRTITVPGKVDKVVAAGPPAEALIYMLAPEKLAGWVKAKSATDKDLLLTKVANLPVLGRLTGEGGAANIAAIRKAKPDLIIDVGDVDPSYVALADKVQKETGIPYVLIDGHLANTQNALRQVGDLLDVTDRADKLATYVDQRFDELSTVLGLVPKNRLRIYYGRGADGLQTGLAGSINTEFIDMLGAVNVAAATGKGGLTRVTVQQVAAWNPDIILIEDPGAFAAVKKNPAWASLKAMKAGRIQSAPDGPFGWLDSPPGANRLMGLVWLEGILYPKHFDSDVPAKVRDFYDEFYQVDLWDVELNELFGGTSLQR
jgi:iron complex transport system substrate-binding protein